MRPVDFGSEAKLAQAKAYEDELARAWRSVNRPRDVASTGATRWTKVRRSALAVRKSAGRRMVRAGLMLMSRERARGSARLRRPDPCAEG